MMSLFPILAALLAVPTTGQPLKSAVAAVGQVTASEPDASGALQVRSRGSGVLIDPQGVFVTNLHLVHDGRHFHPVVHFRLPDPQDPFQDPDPQRRYRARLVAHDSHQDLALFRLTQDSRGAPLAPDSRFPAASLEEVGPLEVLSTVYVVGYPIVGGTTLTVTRGQVSGREDSAGWIKTDAQILQGCSGGALMDDVGRLVGVATRVSPDLRELDTDSDGFPDTLMVLGSVGLARPVHLVKALADKLGQDGLPADPPVLNSAASLLRGRVEGKDGQALPGVLVGLLKPGSRLASLDNLVTWARSDEGGRLVFRDAVRPGRYTVRARAEGFLTYLEDIEIDGFSSDLIIRLRPLAEPKEKEER
ncbi:MAG TPA: trypsin-like peptidase domain-containing protein [Acidobacteriota bacterium]|nr:trypsin-like peptidase domain-containing protein [Acidobacteriota bacterium]